MASSETITVTGTGAAGAPYTPSAKLDPAAGNKIKAGPSGLIVPTLPYLKSYASAPQNRSNGEALAFDSNDSHGEVTIHDDPLSGTNRYFFVIVKTGLWRLTGQASALDTNHVTGLGLKWEDATTGDFVGENGGDGGVATPGTLLCIAVAWLTVGMHVSLASTWNTGAGPLAVDGGGSYGHRTWTFLECLADA